MATTTTSLPAAPARRPRTALVGAMLGSGAAFMTYIGLLAVYLIERSNASLAGADWFPEGVVELGPSGWIFWTMIMSIFTVQWAEWSIKTGDRSNGLWALGLTLMICGTFASSFGMLCLKRASTVEGSIVSTPLDDNPDVSRLRSLQAASARGWTRLGSDPAL